MKAKHRTKRIQRYRKMLGIIVLILTITLIGVVVSATVLYKRKNACWIYLKLDQEFSLNQEETDHRIRGTAVDIAVFFMGVEINSASTGEMVGLIIDHHVQFPLEAYGLTVLHIDVNTCRTI